MTKMCGAILCNRLLCVRFFDTICFPDFLQWNELFAILEAVNIFLTNDKSNNFGEDIFNISSVSTALLCFPVVQVRLLQRTVLLSQSACIFRPLFYWNCEVNALRMEPTLKDLSELLRESWVNGDDESPMTAVWIPNLSWTPYSSVRYKSFFS